MFDDDRPPRPSRSFGAQQKSAKLIITNLDYGVNDQDIRVWCTAFMSYVAVLYITIYLEANCEQSS